jgi:hypothetical protein
MDLTLFERYGAPDRRVPRDRPFTTAQAHDAGVDRRTLDAWVEMGALRRLFRGVYLHASHPLDLDARVAACRLVLPEHAVVTDEVAAWLHGASWALPPDLHGTLPPVTAYCRPGHRLRNSLAASGERVFADRDVVEVGGLAVTTPLRTACDLLRLRRRVRAFECGCALLGLGGMAVDEVGAELSRFRGYRGIVQARTLAPLMDPRCQSAPEAASLLLWHDHGLPRPELQIAVRNGRGGFYYIDLGLEELRFGAEYDGREFHGPDRSEHDRRRRDFLREVSGWRILVLTRDDVYGRQHAWGHLRAEYDAARRRSTLLLLRDA